VAVDHVLCDPVLEDRAAERPQEIGVRELLGVEVLPCSAKSEDSPCGRAAKRR
jgi:hypothetical protein